VRLFQLYLRREVSLVTRTNRVFFFVHSMLRDIDHFQARLSKIDGFGDAGEYLRSIVKRRKAELDAANGVRPAAAAPAATSAESNTTSEDAKDDAAAKSSAETDTAEGAQGAGESETK